MKLPGFAHFGGKHAETAALRNTLAYLGVKAPHTGKPFTEEMLLGIAGGIGAGYMLFEMCGGVYLMLSGRHLGQCIDASFLAGACDRLGASYDVMEAGGSRAAEGNLRLALDRGTPGIVWLGLAGLPWYGLPIEFLKGIVHVTAVYGIEGDFAFLSDRPKTSQKMPAEELAKARSAITSLKNRVLAVRPPAGPIDLHGAVHAGLRACVAGLGKQRIKNFGLSALEKWADAVANRKDKKGWPKVMAKGGDLVRGLISVFTGIETAGTGGGNFRVMFSAFLAEAGDALGEGPLREAGRIYEKAADRWSALAHAALPDAIAPLREARECILQRKALMEGQGGDALAQIQRLSARVAEIEHAAESAPPLDPAGALALFERLREGILAVLAVEREGEAALQAIG